MVFGEPLYNSEQRKAILRQFKEYHDKYWKKRKEKKTKKKRVKRIKRNNLRLFCKVIIIIIIRRRQFSHGWYFK